MQRATLRFLEYAQLAWSGLSATDNRKLERLQRRAARLITGERLGEQSRGNIEHDLLLSRAGLSTLSSRLCLAIKLFHKLLHSRPEPLRELFFPFAHTTSSRCHRKFTTPTPSPTSTHYPLQGILFAEKPNVVKNPGKVRARTNGLFQGFSRHLASRHLNLSSLILMYYYVVPRPTLPISILFLSLCPSLELFPTRHSSTHQQHHIPESH